MWEKRGGKVPPPDGGGPGPPSDSQAFANQQAALYRLRRAKQRAIADELKRVGPLAYLACGSILVGYEKGKIVEPEWAYTYYRDVMMTSLVYDSLAERSKKAWQRAGKQKYDLLEDLFISLGSVVTLAAPDSSDDALCCAMFELKKWIVNHGVIQPDQAFSYVKWLFACVQAVELNAPMPSGESYYPGLNFKTGVVLKTPFVGCLSFIDEAIRRGGRGQWKLEEHRAAAQIAAGKRAMPYPSIKMQRKSVLETIEIMTDNSFVLTDEAERAYKGGLQAIKRQLSELNWHSQTKSSLTNSGSWESPRSEGGRAEVMMSRCREVCDQVLTESMIDSFVGTIDCFDEPLLEASAAELLRMFMRDNPDERPTLGDVLYVPTHEMTSVLQRTVGVNRVPKYLGNIVASVASTMVDCFGRYNGVSTLSYGLIRFAPESKGMIRFTPNHDVDSLPVRAAISIESGGKSRLVTAGLAAVTQLEQLVRHSVADYLSNDPFTKIGFEEGDKLWEVLKAYARLKTAKHDQMQIISTDLSEATYRMPHKILEINREFMAEIMPNDPVLRVFKALFRIHPRSIDLGDLLEKGVLDLSATGGKRVVTSSRGAFMGDSLSFMDLTLVMMSSVWQASFKTMYPARPRSQLLYYDGYIARPIGQTVGDDLVVTGAPAGFGQELRTAFEAVGLKVSKIDAISDDSGTFCEQYFCRPQDVDEQSLLDYNKVSTFGDIFFLDVVKGSILSRKAKVKSDSGSPFIGHARALKKLVDFHPIRRIKSLAPKLLWALNFDEAKGFGRIKAHFPIALGGLEIAVGKLEDLDVPEIRSSYGDFLQAVLELPFEQFMTYEVLLTSILKKNPKGVPWSNNEETVSLVVSRLTTIREDDVKAQIPEYVSAKGYNSIRRYMSHALNLMSVRELSGLLAELETYYSYWRGHTPQPYVTDSVRVSRQRFKSVWTKIRRELQPKPCEYAKLSQLSKAFDNRTWGILFSRNDPVIEEIFDGMSSLIVKWGSRTNF